MTDTIHIKNMVCPRCIKVVKEILSNLEIRFDSITLGSAVICEDLSQEKLISLKSALLKEGFELLDDVQSSQVENIRLHIIEWARMEGERPSLSEYLPEKCLREYSAISKLFSQMKSITIERYAMLQRMEYAKELISYGDKSISEIAWILGFSSPAHFSNQFKKESGMTPTEFRTMHVKDRSCIDKL